MNERIRTYVLLGLLLLGIAVVVWMQLSYRANWLETF
jgi:hypothetical protein